MILFFTSSLAGMDLTSSLFGGLNSIDFIFYFLSSPSRSRVSPVERLTCTAFHQFFVNLETGLNRLLEGHVRK